MTREDAIDILDDIQDNLEKTKFLEKCAIDMAIESLQEETICPIMSDDEVKQPCIKSPCGIERPHGEWNVRHDTMYHFECPFCKYLHQYKDNFCPLCGASMVKEGDKE